MHAHAHAMEPLCGPGAVPPGNVIGMEAWMSASGVMVAAWGSVCVLLVMAVAMRRLLVVQLPELGWWMLGLLLAVLGAAVEGTASSVGLVSGASFAGWVLVASGVVMATHALQQRAGRNALPMWIRAWFALVVCGEAARIALIGPVEGRGLPVGGVLQAALMVPGIWSAARGAHRVGNVALALVAAIWAVAAGWMIGTVGLGGVSGVFSWATGIAVLALAASSLLFSWACLEQVLTQADRWGSHDPLTGCINRSTARTLLEHALQRARRERQTVGLLALDLDHFRRLNLRFGNQSADLVLQCFVDAVRLRLRGSDVFCRWDGDHFNVILPSTDAAGARRLAEDIRAAVSRLKVRTPRHADIGLSVSIGVAVAIADSGSTVEDLLARAENALARAKLAGRNRVELACVEMALVAG